MITGEFIPYLVSFLNSYLFKFCFIDNFPELQGGTREVRKVFFDKIPVKKPTNEINRKCKTILDELISKLEKNEPIQSLERKLNKIILDYYKVSTDDLDLIEQNLPEYFKI